ncbi:uncharacterized protein [Ptychodera flava]|uniref:uncharacterized protein n=1 Tax=Ptychodera flava TaxID=63121 RepID=UPI00396A2C36
MKQSPIYEVFSTHRYMILFLTVVCTSVTNPASSNSTLPVRKCFAGNHENRFAISCTVTKPPKFILPKPPKEESWVTGGCRTGCILGIVVAILIVSTTVGTSLYMKKNQKWCWWGRRSSKVDLSPQVYKES